MPLYFPRFRSRSLRDSDDPLGRFRKVLLAAQHTSRYPPLLERAGLGTPGDVAAVDSIERALAKLPVTDLEEFLGSPELFHSRSAPAGARPKFVYPLAPVPRVAVLEQGVEKAKLERFPPEAIAGPVGTLRELAYAVQDGSVALPSLRNAGVAFTGIRHGELTEDDRLLFWDVFKVPFFEQHVGLDGRLVAQECEAHGGLHVRTGNAVFETLGEQLLMTSLTDTVHPALRLRTGFSAAIETGYCDCGAETPRLRDIRVLVPAKRAAAAVA